MANDGATQSLLPTPTGASQTEANFCNFLRKVVALATQDTLAGIIKSLPTKATLGAILPTLLYPHRMALDPRRCADIERSLYLISRYIHAGEGRADNIAAAYSQLYKAVNGNSSIEDSGTEYQKYAILMMKRYGVGYEFAKMVKDAEDIPLLTEQFEAQQQPSSITADQTTEQKNLQKLLAALAQLDTCVESWQDAAEKKEMQALQTECQKILRIIFKIFYFLFTICGSASGFLGGARVPEILSGHDDVPHPVKYLCGFLGYLCWVFLFLSYRDSVKMISFTYRSVFIIIFSAFTALPSALFAGSNMEKIIDSFLDTAPEIFKIVIPYAAQFSSFSSNFALNLGVTDLLLAVPKQISRFTHGIRHPVEAILATISLITAAGAGVAGIVPYISSKNLIPHTNLPGIVNLLLSVFGDLPSAMLGAVCLINGTEPWAVLTNPQYRWIGRLTGLVLGVIAPIIFFGFNADSIEDEAGPLHMLNFKVLYWFIQILAGLGNFMAYGKLGLYIQNMFCAPPIPPLFPPSSQ
jgi:hypothetical protein